MYIYVPLFSLTEHLKSSKPIWVYLISKQVILPYNSMKCILIRIASILSIKLDIFRSGAFWDPNSVRMRLKLNFSLVHVKPMDVQKLITTKQRSITV